MPKSKEHNHDSLMELLATTDDLDIFDTKVVRDLIQYHWDNYALHVHSFGALMHLAYALTFFIYVHQVFSYRDYTLRSELILLMFVCLLYPVSFEAMQVHREGCTKYFSDIWNNIDQCFVW